MDDHPADSTGPRRRPILFLALLAGACARQPVQPTTPSAGQAQRNTPVVSDQALATFGQSLGGAGGGPALAKKQASDELASILAQFAKTSDVSRARLVHTVRTKVDEFEELLRQLVAAGADTSPDLLIPAIEIVAWLRLSGPESDLLHHAERGLGCVRAAAVRALHRYGFWSRGTVLPRLSDPDPEFLVALLSVAALLDDPPAAELVPLLGHADASVREAAANAIPSSAGQAAIQALESFASKAPPPQKIEAFRVLGRLAASPERDASLGRGVQSNDWSVRQAAMLALAEGTGTLADPAPLWQRLEDPKATVMEQVHALVVLERRGVRDLRSLPTRAAKMHPVVKLHAARCLLAAGDASAPRLLIDLLTTVEGPSVDDEDRSCARGEAQRILTELAEQDLGEAPEPWTRWHRSVGSLGPRQLVTPPSLFW